MTNARRLPRRLFDAELKKKIVNRTMNDDRISTCKRCGRGVFASHKNRVWQTRPVIGWVHSDCLP